VEEFVALTGFVADPGGSAPAFGREEGNRAPDPVPTAGAVGSKWLRPLRGPQILDETSEFAKTRTNALCPNPSPDFPFWTSTKTNFHFRGQ